jgi:hypothetical protein
VGCWIYIMLGSYLVIQLLVGAALYCHIQKHNSGSHEGSDRRLEVLHIPHAVHKVCFRGYELGDNHVTQLRDLIVSYFRVP